MNRVIRNFTYLIILASTPIASIADQPNHDASFVYEIASPSIILVHSENSSIKSQGSGICVGNGLQIKSDAKGFSPEDFEKASSWIYTNAHVIVDENKTFIKYKKDNYKAEVKYLDRDFDIAILFVPNVVIKTSVPAVGSYNIGNEVYAIGSPLGLENSISDGIISGTRQKDKVPLIQTTAPISPGNSGGGLFDKSGKLIGITTFKLKGGENLNFAIDVAFVNQLDEAIMPAELISASEPSLVKPEIYKFINWLASEKAENGMPYYKYYNAEVERLLKQGDAEGAVKLDSDTLAKFRYLSQKQSSSKSQKSINEEANPSAHIVLDCEIQGPTKPSYLTLNIERQLSSLV